MLYAIVYELQKGHPTDVEFEKEYDMEDYYYTWVADDDYKFCSFFYCDREYTPSWMK